MGDRLKLIVKKIFACAKVDKKVKSRNKLDGKTHFIKIKDGLIKSLSKQKHPVTTMK